MGIEGSTQRCGPNDCHRSAIKSSTDVPDGVSMARVGKSPGNTGAGNTR